jgi:hypothetical protein
VLICEVRFGAPETVETAPETICQLATPSTSGACRMEATTCSLASCLWNGDKKLFILFANCVPITP